ncbi:MAG: tRNA lysidine(34) synthetase TilS [Anaerovoracaceae bacterium]|nr:tRNA lysidine(34) synthetase TilS [Anaerovoracaceae bacterium]
MITEKVRNAILQNSLLDPGDHVVIGVSGGPDSVCLLHILKGFSEEWDLHLHGVHVNHGLRGADADSDQTYTEELCAQLDVPCHTFSCDISVLAKEWHMTEEEAGREARYQAFEEVRREILTRKQHEGKAVPAVKIAVAQNMNDQAETVLMRVLRGTGVDGLAGMEYMRDGVVIRPLLDVTRTEIEQYCREYGLNPHTDQTNLEPVYTRNKIRIELLPYLEEHFNPGITKALSRLSKIAAEDKSYIFGTLPEMELSEDRKRCSYNRKVLRELHSAVRKRAVSVGFKEIGLTQDISSIHLDEADRLIREGRTSEMMDFPGGYGLRLNYEKVELFRKTKQEAEQEACYAFKLLDGEEVSALNGTLKVKILSGEAAEKVEYLLSDKRRAIFDKSLMDYGELELRTRRPGDWIRPSGMNGTKKIQDYFVDAKIPQDERNRIPLICLGSEVLWIIGFRSSENFKAAEPRKGVVYLEYDGVL